jgi:hypothetical protein
MEKSENGIGLLMDEIIILTVFRGSHSLTLPYGAYNYSVIFHTAVLTAEALSEPISVSASY